MNRRTAREKALQVLFQIDVNQNKPEEVLTTFLKNKDTEDQFIQKVVYGVLNHLDEIDDQIQHKLENWRFDRIAAVERTVLRMAFYELLFLKDTPIAVVMNESVDLAKRFGDDASGKFVNGVLSKFSD